MANATTGSAAALAATVRTRCNELTTLVARAARGDTRAIHRTRTNSRRLRELLPVADAIAPGAGAKRLRRTAKKLTRALGPVRELDVAIASLADEACGRAVTGAEISAVARALETERAAARDRLRTRLDAFDLDHWRARTRELIDAIAKAPAGRAWEATLGKRVRRRADRLLDAVESSGTLYAPDALHAVRIAAKKLRYSLEIAHDVAGLPIDRMVRSIKSVQDRLGVIHDLHVLDRRIRAISWPGGRRAAALRRPALLSALEQECREQHAAYLARRDALIALARQAATGVANALGRRRPARMKLTTRVPRHRRAAS
jgi:CHAD domain-containing protein